LFDRKGLRKLGGEVGDVADAPAEGTEEQAAELAFVDGLEGLSHLKVQTF
jgi:hypothetical protein